MYMCMVVYVLYRYAAVEPAAADIGLYVNAHKTEYVL